MFKVTRILWLIAVHNVQSLLTVNYLMHYLKNICLLSFAGYKKEIFQPGDRLIVVHSHELHPPALPRKCTLLVSFPFSLSAKFSSSFICSLIQSSVNSYKAYTGKFVSLLRSDGN